MSDYGLTTVGFIAPTASDLRLIIRQTYEALVGEAVDWDADGFLGTWTETHALRNEAAWQALQQAVDARDVDNAVGTQLDILLRLVGITRREATRSSVPVGVTGTNGTVIAAGKLIRDDDGNLWELRDALTISGGIASGTADAVEAGSLNAASGTITTIVSAVNGWTTVSNSAAATPGADREKDEELRRRFRQNVPRAGGTLAQIREEVLLVEDVQAVSAIDNPTRGTVVIDGITLSPNSIAVVVYPASITAEQKQAVADAIHNSVPGGTELMGDQSYTVIGEDTYSKTVLYSFASASTVNVVSTLTLDAGYDIVDVGPEVTAAVEAVFDNYFVGEDVHLLALLGAIAGVKGVLTAAVTLNGGTADIVIGATEVATLGTNTATL